MKQLIIRADASTAIGTGHVMRMIALAQAWRRRGGDVRFVSCACPDGIRERVTESGFSMEMLEAVPGSDEDLRATLAILAEEEASVVLDNYHFDPAYQEAVRGAAVGLLVVDDFAHQDSYCADLLLNQNPGSERLGLARRAGDAQLLLGTKFALLREEFLNALRPTGAAGSPPLKVLVMVGGGDPDNVTAKVLQALARCLGDVARVRVIVGAANPHGDELRSFGEAQPFPIEFLENARDMPAQMAWADFVVSAAGSTCWELALMRCPVAVVVVADNQRELADVMGEWGAVINMGWHGELAVEDMSSRLAPVFSNRDLRSELSCRLGGLVSGSGADHVAALLAGEDVFLRKADVGDEEFLLHLANDPAVRASAFNTAPISPEGHHRWFAKKLEDTDSLILIAKRASGGLIGQIRFDLTADNSAEIDVSIVPGERGKALGKTLVRLGIGWFQATRPRAVARAKVKVGNDASVRAFERAGFTNLGERLFEGETCIELELK